MTSVESHQSRRQASTRGKLLVAVALIVPNILLWTGILSVDGIIIQRDFNFPIFNENFEGAYFPLWNEFTSQTNMERFPRLLMMAPFLALSQIGLDVSVLLKLMIVGAFTLITTGAYLFAAAILRRISGTRNNGWTIRLLSLISAFVFVYNPVNLQFIGGISILLSVGMLPWLLYFILRTARKNYFVFLIPVPLLFSLGHPFVFIMNAFIAVVFALVIYRGFLSSRFMISRLLISGVILSLFLAWFWIPYSSFPITSIDLGREENLEREKFETVSDNDFYKIVLLERDRFIYTATNPAENIGQFLHYFALVSLVGIAFSSLLFHLSRIQKVTILLFCGGYIITTLLALGSNGPLGEAYWLLVSETSIGWIFRSPLKFQLYQAFFISMLAAMSLMVVREKLSSSRISYHIYKLIVPVFMILAIAGSSGYGLHDANTSSFNPISIPTEYYEINEILLSKYDGTKVVYYPRYNEIATDWSQGHMIPPFDMKSSKIPTYDTSITYTYVKNALYDYPYADKDWKTVSFQGYLSSVGVRYMVFHDDRGYESDRKNLEYLLDSENMQLLYSQNGWYLFEIESQPQQLRAVSTVAEVHGLKGAIDVSTFSRPAIDASILADTSGLPDDSMVEVLLTNISASTSLPNLLNNPSFEFWTDGKADRWTGPREGFMIASHAEQHSNSTILEISTSRSDKNVWSGLISDEIEVQPNAKYLLTLDTMTQNAYGSHAKIQGYNSSSTAWRDIVFVTSDDTSSRLSMSPNSDWRTYWTTAEIPDNIFKIRYVIHGGSGEDPSFGKALTYVRNAGIFDLSTNRQNELPIIEYVKVSPTQFNVDVKSQKPFVLVLSESFDKGWTASYGQTDIKSIPLYGMINGFYVEKTGDFTLSVDYRPQKLFEIGAAVSLATALGVIAFVIILRSSSIKSNDSRLITRFSLGTKWINSRIVDWTSAPAMTEELSTVTGEYTARIEKEMLANDKPWTINGQMNYSKQPEKKRSKRSHSIMSLNLFRNIATNIPMLVALILLFYIPFSILQFSEGDNASMISSFALDFLIVGVIWKLISPLLKNNPEQKHSAKAPRYNGSSRVDRRRD